MKQLVFYQQLNTGLDVTTSEDIYIFLSRNKYIDRDFNTNKIVCLVGLYENEGDTKLDTSLFDEIEQRLQEYRILFKPVRTGGMGNKQTCLEYLVRFCAVNKKTFDEVLEVTQWYIRTSPLPANADNFIYNTDITSGREKSRLETAFEEFETTDQTWKSI